MRTCAAFPRKIQRVVHLLGLGISSLLVQLQLRGMLDRSQHRLGLELLLKSKEWIEMGMPEKMDV
jgi:hypothetical protein